MSRNAIKYIVALLMVINHIAGVFMAPFTLSSEIMLSIGYATAVTMCFFAVEGLRHTHDRKKYLERIFIFALISQLPFDLAFTKDASISFQGLNFLFNLGFSLLLVLASEEIESPVKKTLSVILLVLLSLISDWSVMGPVFILLFYWAGKDRKKLLKAYLLSSLFFALNMFSTNLETLPLLTNVIYSLMNGCGILVSAVLILCFYNGKKGKGNGKWSKWFFYAFYPLHLSVFGLIRIFTC